MVNAPNIPSFSTVFLGVPANEAMAYLIQFADLLNQFSTYEQPIDSGCPSVSQGGL
ncbi:hypothetical protein R50073_01710 [Maricurvus nonylphenolicus]